jgi:FemAB-related protein (PEP-CTERM system-associated)
MKIQLYDDQEKDWNDYVIKNDNSTFFHQIQYKKVIEESLGHKAYYLIASKDGCIVGVLPCFLVRSKLFGSCLVSLPFCDYGGVLADDPVIERALFDKALQIASNENAQFMEFRCRYPNKLGLLWNMDKVNLRLPLKTEKEVWQDLSSKVRNQVRKAQKSGLGFEVGDINQLPNFYKVYSINMRDLGTPVYPMSLFGAFLKHFHLSSEILLITHEGKVIGGAIAIYFKNAMEVPWASSLRSYFKYCPNNLLYWSAISKGCNMGLEYFDFGRSTKDSSKYMFKKQWGAHDEQLFYQFIPVKGKVVSMDPSNLRYKMGVNLWKKLPLFMANVIGPCISKYIP